MNREPLGRVLFAGGIVAVALLGLVYRNLLMWDTVPDGLPAPTLVAVGSALLLLATGAGLFSARFDARASRVLLIYLLLWVLLLAVFPLAKAPLAEMSWLELGMYTMVLLAGWLITGKAHVRLTRTLYGLALIPVGLSHFFYWQITMDLVPKYLPAPAFWVVLGGAAHLAAGVGILLGVFPRLAAMMEAGMLMAFTVIVWIPAVIASPGTHFNWTELVGSWVVGAAAWVVADSYAGIPWLSVGRLPSPE